jgi:hypothetical protein
LLVVVDQEEEAAAAVKRAAAAEIKEDFRVTLLVGNIVNLVIVV